MYFLTYYVLLALVVLALAIAAGFLARDLVREHRARRPDRGSRLDRGRDRGSHPPAGGTPAHSPSRP
ncbi:MAG: hypothetical protein ACODAU_12995 [Myxococcota bacterium]